MGSITSLKCVLTQEHLDAICAKYFVPEEVHPQLPSSDATMHERPAGKVGMYTRFFDYANYRIPFSTFFVSVLTHFRIPFSQLSVFGSAKVSHFEILCRVCNINPSVGLFRYFYTHNYKNGWFGFTKRPNVRACYSKNLDSVKNWNDHFFWVDEFVVPANARFEMDLNAFIRTADPRKMRIVERARAEMTRLSYGAKASEPSGAFGPTGGPSFPLVEGGDHTDSMTGPSLRTVGPSTRFVVLSDSSLALGAILSPTTIDAGKNKDVSALSVFAGSSSSDRTGRTLSLFTGRSGSEFAAGSIHARENADVNLQEVYVPEWSVTKGFELNDGRSCANMIDYFTPPAFFKTVCGMEHEQLFAEFNVSAARNLSLSSKVRMRAEYNILEKIRWKSFAKEKDNLLQVKDKEIEELSLEAIEGSLRGEVASAKEHNGLLKQECGSLKLKVTSLEYITAEKERDF
ncbi:hypothetical protein Tco_0579333 [Tanacetum coccineum]